MADVPAPSYPTPNWDKFGDTVGNLASTYRQGVQDDNVLAEQKIKLGLAKVFQGGVPMTPQGQPDYAKAMSMLAAAGDPAAIGSLGPLVQDQQFLNGAGQISPLLGGGSVGAPVGAPAQPAPQQPFPQQPAQPVGDIPPASAAGAMTTRPAGYRPPAPGGAPNAGPFGNVGGAAERIDPSTSAGGAPAGVTLDSVVNQVLPADVDPIKRAKVTANLARALKVDFRTPLTPEQTARAQQLLASYAERNGIAAGSGAGYDEPTTAGVRPPGNLRFRDSVQDLQQDAGDLGISTEMISGQRSARDQMELRANMEAGQRGLPLPYPQRGPVAVSASPGESPHEQGVAADVQAYGPGGQQALVDMARSPWRNLKPGADFGDPNHFQAANAGGGRAAPERPAGGQGAPPGAGGGQNLFAEAQQVALPYDREIARLSAAGGKYADAQIRALEDARERAVKAVMPFEVRPGETIVGPDGGVRFQAPLANANALAMQRFFEENPNATAAQIQAFQRAGQAPRSGIGMFIQRYTEEHPNATSDELARVVQGYTGGNAGATVLGKREVGLQLAENEASALIPAVRDASAAVPRTQYPSLNSVMMAAQQGTGGENVVRLAIAVESLTQAYARALSPTGSPIAADKAHAHELLDKAWSQGQIEAALDQMQKEIDRAEQSLKKTKDDRARGGAPARETPAPAATTAAGSRIPAGWSVEVH